MGSLTEIKKKGETQQQLDKLKNQIFLARQVIENAGINIQKDQRDALLGLVEDVESELKRVRKVAKKRKGLLLSAKGMEATAAATEAQAAGLPPDLAANAIGYAIAMRKGAKAVYEALDHDIADVELDDDDDDGGRGGSQGATPTGMGGPTPTGGMGATPTGIR